MAPLGEVEKTTHVILRRSQTTTTVVIVGLTIVSAVSVGLLLVLLVTRLQRRKQLKQQDPDELTEKTTRKWHNSFVSWRNKPTENEPSYDEIQREVLIRKSLASRAESRASGQISPTSDEDADLEEQQDLRTDWKQWEARVQHERSISTESHPAFTPSANEPRDLELLRPISTVSSLNWSPLDELPQLPMTARTTGAPTHSLQLNTGGATYGRLATDEDGRA